MILKTLKFTFLLTISLLFLNCQNVKEDQLLNNDVISMADGSSQTSTYSSDNTLAIGKFKIHKEEVNYIQKNVLASLKRNNDEFSNSTSIIATSLVKNTDGNFVLRTVFDNEYVSNSLLNLNSSNARVDATNSMGTTCTSKACGKCCGCQPQMNGYCTGCDTGNKDCERSTSN